MRTYSAIALQAARTAAVCFLLALTGCAGLGILSTPEEQVKARAQARRDAILKGDFKKAYEYFTPGYRGAVSADTYVGSIGRALVTVGATVESVECETLEKCVAQVKVEIKPLAVRRFNGTITSYSVETWLFEAGQWWFFQNL